MRDDLIKKIKNILFYKIKKVIKKYSKITIQLITEINFKKLTYFFLLIPTLLFSQSYKTEEILGNWQIKKCELYKNNELIKSSYFNENSIKVLEGKSVGIIDNDVNNVMKTIIGANIAFNEDSTVTWDVSINGLNFSSAYWQLLETGEIVFCEWQNRDKLRPILAECKIVGIQGNTFYINSFQEGFEVRLTLSR